MFGKIKDFIKHTVLRRPRPEPPEYHYNRAERRRMIRALPVRAWRLMYFGKGGTRLPRRDVRKQLFRHLRSLSRQDTWREGLSQRGG